MSTGVETQVETETAQQTAIEPTEPTQTASPACAYIEGQAVSSDSTDDATDDDTN